MKSYFLLLIPLLLLLALSGCSPRYDYTVHKPGAYFDHPSKSNLRKILRRKVGDDYVWAEEGPHEFDCSGLVYYCYGTMNAYLPRVASEQAKVGRYVSRDDLQYGDLIFFDTTSRRSGKITHVGIYVGGGKFQHAANERRGVIITPLNHKYYGSRIVTCRRILPDEDRKVGTMPTGRFTSMTGIEVADNKNVEEVCEKCYEVTEKATDNTGDHYIQVGIFTHAPQAAFLEHLRVSGYSYKIRSVYRNGVRMTQLLVGPFQTKEKALEILPDAQALFNPGAFIVKM